MTWLNVEKLENMNKQKKQKGGVIRKGDKKTLTATTQR